MLCGKTCFPVEHKVQNQWIVLFQIKSATTDTQTLVWVLILSQTFCIFSLAIATEKYV